MMNFNYISIKPRKLFTFVLKNCLYLACVCLYFLCFYYSSFDTNINASVFISCAIKYAATTE